LLSERFRRHAASADVVRQELEREEGIRFDLRTVEREVSHLRRERMRGDDRFRGRRRASRLILTSAGIDRQRERKVYFFVATRGNSRLYERPLRNERLESWLAGVEGAFRHFGGVTEQVLLDNEMNTAWSHVTSGYWGCVLARQ
jgi:transposase